MVVILNIHFLTDISAGNRILAFIPPYMRVIANLMFNTVEKMNETYEAMTVTPEGSNVGVNVNMEKFFEAYENGTPYEDVVDKAVNVIEGGFANQPSRNGDCKFYCYFYNDAYDCICAGTGGRSPGVHL